MNFSFRVLALLPELPTVAVAVVNFPLNSSDTLLFLDTTGIVATACIVWAFM
jgi:hypothetical protein